MAGTQELYEHLVELEDRNAELEAQAIRQQDRIGDLEARLRAALLETDPAQ